MSGGAVPTVNNVALTGPDGVNPVAARAERVRRIPVGRDAWNAAGAGARRAHQSRAGPAARRRSDCSTICASFQRVLFTNRSGARPGRRGQRRHDAAAGCRSAAERARAAGQGRLRARVQPVSWRPGPVDRRRRRSFAFTTSRTQCPRPVDTVDAGALRVRRRARRSSPATPGPTRSRCRTARRSAAPARDPGRALLTGFVGGAAAAQDDWNKLDVPATARHQQDRAVLPQQQRRHARRSRRSLHRVLQARAGELRAQASRRRLRRPTACTSIGGRLRRSARRCWRTCGGFSAAALKSRDAARSSTPDEARCSFAIGGPEMTRSPRVRLERRANDALPTSYAE